MKLSPFAAVLLAFPLAAAAAVYKWTDERGGTVFSNQPPRAGAKVSHVQLVVEDDKPAPAAADKEKDLQDRVKTLEQQVQALQSQPPAYAPGPAYYPQPSYSETPYYAAAYPPPMYDYPYPYAYPYVYPYVIVAPRRFVRPVHGFVHHPIGARPMPVMRAGFRAR